MPLHIILDLPGGDITPGSILDPLSPYNGTPVTVIISDTTGEK